MGERNDLIENEDACYLLVKRGLYYRPDRQGYTGIKEKAGRYTRADGEQLSRSGVSFVHVDEAEEYSPSCNAETKADHLQAVLADRDATIASLSEALAEAEKKGAEDWQPIETAPRDGTSFLGWDGYNMWPCKKVEDGPVIAIGQRVIGIMCGSDVRLWRPLPVPPRDLSQGGQHG